MEEKIIISDWQEEYLAEKPVGDSKYFSDAVPEGQLVYTTIFKFLTEGEKQTNKFGKQVISFKILHEGKEKILDIGATQYEVLKVIAKAKPIINKEVEWQRSGTTQKDTRRAIKVKAWSLIHGKSWGTGCYYTQNPKTRWKNDWESDFIKSGDIMQSNANMTQTVENVVAPNEVYKAILPSDGISLIVPKDKSKIALAKYLLDRLEKELDEKK